jgi:hypothetical protein
MEQNLSNKLRETLDRELPYLNALPETQAAAAPQKPGGWSPKQELGHLLDSALNNHMRFVRAALEGSYNGPSYAQDDWVKLHAWEQLPWTSIVGFWYHHNLLLVHVIARISTERLDSHCVIGHGPAVTLRFLIVDYVLHMQHHLDHLLSREVITQYPGA